jgi:ubiquitin carboxyl-terminal hydrolase 8
MDDYKKVDYYKDKGKSGLKNMGNTCYMNSAIQCLSNTLELSHYFLSRQYEKDINKKNPTKLQYHLVLRYIDLLINMWKDNQIIIPKTFKMTIEAFVKRFVGYNQHDSHECIISMLDLLHQGLSVPVEMHITGKVKSEHDKLRRKAVEVWKENFSSNYSHILKIFYGQNHTSMECPDCDYASHNFDPFSCLSLNINDDTKTLEECFDYNMNGVEILDDDNKWFCEECKEKKNGRRTNRVWTLPPVLIIQLKKYNKSRKVNTTITFDMDDLDLTKYISPIKNNKTKYKYELYSVNNHSGGLNGGHYWSLCKKSDDKWYNFNDSCVSPISKSKVIGEDNYILFFRRK